MNPLFKEIRSLSTERTNEATDRIDVMSTLEILQCINAEDAKVPGAVGEELTRIGEAVDLVVRAFTDGGRLFYVGAGTSGRLGIVDASECPPTFGVTPDLVQAFIAGGPDAVFTAKEGAEDRREDGAAVIHEHDVTTHDVVCGIAASGRTPFVRGALDACAERGIPTILVTTNSRENLRELGVTADVIIAPQVGPEVLAGSTRMKSGTAQKLVLNMLTTTAMIRCGKTYGNIMVDLQLTNAKLRERAKNIVMTVAGVGYEQASLLLDETKGDVKSALIMAIAGCSSAVARLHLRSAGGFTRLAIQSALRSSA
ncbi:MAG: N-acetylmuramic acid 6-phosphate etherase [Candidatus Kapaibacterium sp.]